MAEVEARKGSVTSMVTSKNYVGALTAALADPEKVLASKSANVKVRQFPCSRRQCRDPGSVDT